MASWGQCTSGPEEHQALKTSLLSSLGRVPRYGLHLRRHVPASNDCCGTIDINIINIDINIPNGYFQPHQMKLRKTKAAPCVEDAIIKQLGSCPWELTPSHQALTSHLACQLCKELVAGHAAVEGQQVEKSVNVHLILLGPQTDE